MPANDRWRMYQGIPPSTFRDLDEIRRRFDANVTQPFMHAFWDRIPEEMKGFSPAVDIIEKGDQFLVKIEIPGTKQDDIDLSINDDMLTIKGERKPESGAKDADYNRNEIAYGNFYRTVALPASVDVKNIDAVYEDGILRVTLHRASTAKPNKINIKSKTSAS